MPHGASKVAKEREAAARAKGFSPSNPDPGGFNLFAAIARNKVIKSINAAEAAGKAPAAKAKAKTTKPAARVSTAKTRTPRPIPNDKKRKKLGSTERSLLG